MEIQAFDDGCAGNVGEVHILQLHIAQHPGQLGGVFCIFRLRLCVDQAEYPLRCRKGTLQFGDDVGHLVDGAGETPGILHEGAQVSQTDASLHVLHRAKHANQRQRQIVDEHDRRTGDGAVGLRLGVCGYGRIVFLVELLQHHILPAVGPDGFLAI